MTAESTFSLGVVLLAAGASSRMGRPKLLLPWEGTTVLGHLVARWTKLGAAQVGVVCAPADAAIAAELDRLGFPAANRITNPEPTRGMFSSIQCAARWDGWQRGSTHRAVVLGDQPHLRIATLSACIEFASSRPEKIVQPARHGRPRHPVIFPGSAFDELARSTAGSLREFLQGKSGSVERVELDDPGLDLDLDRPSDYEAALKLNDRER